METREEKVLLPIGGMTCVNCQNKIEKALKNTDGVLDVHISYSCGRGEIHYDGERVSLQNIVAVIEELGYTVPRDGRGKTPDLLRTVCLLVILIALYVILQKTGLLNLLAPSQLAESKMGYGMLFVIGLLTSVHCIAMCGGLNLSQCMPQADSGAEHPGKGAAFRPALLYNLGRVIAYTGIGFVLGLIGLLIGGGAETGMGALLSGVLKLIAGAFMVIMGVNLLGLFPALRSVGIRMPRFFARGVSREQARRNRPLYVGLLNGLMPCGPLQSMWMVALATGSPVAGALSMFLFSLGTVPLMLGLGSLVSLLGQRFTDQVRTVGGVLVAVLGLAMLSQGGSLSGWLSAELLLTLVIALSAAGVLLSIPVQKREERQLLKLIAVVLVVGAVLFWKHQGVPGSGGGTDGNTTVTVADGVQVVHSTLESGRYPNITVQAGLPVKWIIDAPQGSVNGCNYQVQIPDLNLEYTFQTGENVIEFTAEEPGTIPYSCWMGMIHGTILVTDGTEESNYGQ